MARVAVIIPTFERAAYLDEALHTAATQDFDDLVVVVSDNASTDDTPDVVERARAQYGARVEYIRRPVNLGWNANFNLSISETESEFVLMLGDDDRLLPGIISRSVAALDRAPSAGLAHSAFETIDAEGSKIEGVATDWTEGLTGDALEPGPVFIERSMPVVTRVFTHSALIRRAALPEVPWDPADGLSADCLLWMRIALAWDMQFLATLGGQRRVHRSSLSMGYGPLMGNDYLMEPDEVLELRNNKLRFIERHAAQLDDPRALRRSATHACRHDLAAYARGISGTSRSVGARALAHVVRLQPSVVLDPWTWRAVAKVIVGPRLSARLGTG